MNQKDFLREVAARSGCSLEQTEHFYTALVETMAGVLAQGEVVACLEAWGQFIPKLRDNTGRNANSPRRERKSYYLIQFKPSKKFERALCANLEQE